LDGLCRLQVRIFSLLGRNAFGVHGLRHSLYDVSTSNINEMVRCVA
jgi:hypothetical protein